MSDKPMPLFQLLVLCMLASKPIDAGIAMAAARELFKTGLRTPKAVREADRQTMIDAFGRAHYVRYDESSATRLADMAVRVHDDYSGDLRRLADRSQHDPMTAKRMLKEFKGIGDTGADIYLREVQDVWTWVRPYFDDRTTDTAKQLGLPAEPKKLGSLAPHDNARLAAALVRASLDDDVRRRVTC
jgi:transposase-like protein